MHYKNGREAKIGDNIIAPIYRGGSEPAPTAAVVSGLTPSATACNAQVAYIIPGQVTSTCVTVGDCVHVEDAFAAFSSPPKPS
jgi:hypothetical protein